MKLKTQWQACDKSSQTPSRHLGSLNYTIFNYKRHHRGRITTHQHDFLYVPLRKPPSERAGRLAASRWWFSGGCSSAAWQPFALRRWQSRASVSCPCWEGRQPSWCCRCCARQTSTRWATWHSADTPSPPAAEAVVGWGRTAESERGALIGRLEAQWEWGNQWGFWGWDRWGWRRDCDGHWVLMSSRLRKEQKR